MIETIIRKQVRRVLNEWAEKKALEEDSLISTKEEKESEEEEKEEKED